MTDSRGVAVLVADLDAHAARLVFGVPGAKVVGSLMRWSIRRPATG